MVAEDLERLSPARRDFYQRLRARLAGWMESDEGRRYRFARFLLMVPDLFHLVVRLMTDRRIPGALRSQLFVVGAYVMTPLDIMPEAVIGPTGFADDLLLMVLMLHRVLQSVPREVVLEHWAGDADLIEVIRSVLARAEDLVGGRVLSRLRRMVAGGRQDR